GNGMARFAASGRFVVMRHPRASLSNTGTATLRKLRCFRRIVNYTTRSLHPVRRRDSSVVPPAPVANSLTPAQLPAILEAMRTHYPHYALVATLASTGHRFCHASPLRWEDWTNKRACTAVRKHSRGEISLGKTSDHQAPPPLPRCSKHLSVSWHPKT